MFALSEDEHKKYREWNLEHIKTCPLFGNDGAIGGRLTFCFTPTGLGNITVVKCCCGEEINLTDFDLW